jgi:hypothetical protein
MKITFENNNVVIVYAFEKIISYARDNWLIFMAQCVWWLASIVNLEQGLIGNINNKHSRIEVTNTTWSHEHRGVSVTPRDLTNNPRDREDQHDLILKDCQEYLRQSRQLQDIANIKATGRTKSGYLNQSKVSKRISRKEVKIVKGSGKDYRLTKGISEKEISRRRSTDECLRCAAPIKRKGGHRVKDLVTLMKETIGTPSHPKEKKYQSNFSLSHIGQEE